MALGTAALPRDAAGWADALVFAGVLGLIVVTPWFRGLFFPGEQMVALLLALALFAARWWAKFARNDYSFLRGPLDWAVFGLWLAYLASTFVAANVRDAIQADIKVLLYFIAYWLVRELARDERRRALLVGAVAVTGAWVAVLGVGAAAGTFRFPGAFDGLRIYSAFQYPNTTAAYLTAALAAAVALWARAAAPAWLPVPGEARTPAAGEAALRPLAAAAGQRGAAAVALWAPLARSAPALPWAAAAYAILFCLVFTYSRGGWLVLPVAAALLVALLPRGHRLGGALLLAALATAFAPGAALFPAAVQAKAAGAAWRAFLLGVPLAVVGAAAAAWLVALPGRTRVALLMLTAAASAGTVLVLVPRLAETGLVERLRGINLQALSAQERIDWIATALRIFRDHPLLGAGGGAWDAFYHQYQRYGYYSTQVHGHYAQVAAETGVVGLAALAAMWVFVLLRAWRLWRGGRSAGGDGSMRPAADRCLAAGALAGALALGLHSAVDFNLSLAAVSVALWALAGLLESAGTPGAPPGSQKEYLLLPRAAVYGFTALAIAGVGSLLLGFRYGQQAAAALQGGRGGEARTAFERAVAYDPFTASFRIDLGQIYEAVSRQTGDAALLARARQSLEHGLRLERHNPNFHAIYGVFLLRSGELERGMAELERSVALHPYEIRRYETFADALLAVGIQLAAAGKREEAAPLAERALALRAQLQARGATVPPWVPEYSRLPVTTPGLALRWGQALILRGDLRGAEGELRAAEGSDSAPLRAEAQLWLGQVLARSGKQQEAASYLEKAKQTDGAVAERAEAVAQLVAGVPVQPASR